VRARTLDVRILLADDHPLFRDALRTIVQQAFADATLLEAGDVGGIYAALGDDIDLLLLDLAIPGARGFSALIALRAQYPALPIVVVSGRGDPLTVARALSHGAAGFIPKSAQAGTITNAIQRVLAGDVFDPMQHSPLTISSDERALAQQLRELTPAQFRVLLGICEGKLNKQIAHELAITEATVKAHVTAVLRKLGAHHRTQLLAMTATLAVENASG
jgi:DNA-binding NarL/FixJ family response regulator